jgi:hypothetical protein
VKHAAVKHSARGVARQAKAGTRQAKAGTRQAKAGTRQAKAGTRQAKGAASRAAAGEAAVRPAGTQASGRRWLRQIPYCVVLAGLAAGLLTVRGGGQAVKSGTLVIAGALLAGALIRLVLPDGRAGMLASRRRLADVAVLAALGVGLLVAGVFARVTS